MIRNPDGSPYKVTGNIQMFDPNSPDHVLIDDLDAEHIELSGSPIIYYKMYMDASIDPLYGEQRNKIRSQQGISLFAYYEPQASLNQISMGVIDSPDQAIFQVSLKAWLEKVKEMPVVGGVITTPMDDQKWEIIQRNNQDFTLWKRRRIEIYTKKWQKTKTDNDVPRQYEIK